MAYFELLIEAGRGEDCASAGADGVVEGRKRAGCLDRGGGGGGRLGKIVSPSTIAGLQAHLPPWLRPASLETSGTSSGRFGWSTAEVPPPEASSFLKRLALPQLPQPSFLSQAGIAVRERVRGSASVACPVLTVSSADPLPFELLIEREGEVCLPERRNTSCALFGRRLLAFFNPNRFCECLKLLPKRLVGGNAAEVPPPGGVFFPNRLALPLPSSFLSGPEAPHAILGIQSDTNGS